MRIFLTGGTGFLGSHVAEAALRDRHEVRALARPTADIQHLEGIGAEVVQGDLNDPRSLRAGAAGCDMVIHAAAKVADWGPWREYYEHSVRASRRVYDAAVDAGVTRAVHVSSVAVYGKKTLRRGAVEESMGPVPAEQLPKWYYYGRAKSLAETLAMEYHHAGLLRMTVIRPGLVCGPRDHTTLGHLIPVLERGGARCIGDGSNVLRLVYVTDVADAIMLGATEEAAVGEAFNVTGGDDVTQRDYFDGLTDMLGAPRVSRSVPYRVAFAIATASETAHRLLGITRRPFVTRQAVMLLAQPHPFVTGKIHERLGWVPKVDFATAIERIRAWWEDEPFAPSTWRESRERERVLAAPGAGTPHTSEHRSAPKPR